jgi:hypothetical protein
MGSEQAPPASINSYFLRLCGAFFDEKRRASSLHSLVKEEVYTRATSNAFNDLKRLRMLDDNAFRCLRTNAV